jgi:hypothetical protein
MQWWLALLRKATLRVASCKVETHCAELHFMSGGCRSIEPEVYPRPDGTVYVCGEPAAVPVPAGGPAAVSLEQQSLQVLQVGEAAAGAVSFTVSVTVCRPAVNCLWLFSSSVSIQHTCSHACLSTNMCKQLTSAFSDPGNCSSAMQPSCWLSSTVGAFCGLVLC